MVTAKPKKSSKPKANSVGYYVSMLHRYWQIYIDRALAPLGIGSGQLPILIYLLQHDGVKQADIVHHLRADKSSTARTIRKLVDEGYIERLPNADDGRAYHIQVTAKARAVREQLLSTLSAWTDAVSQDLTADERSMLYSMLDRMRWRAEELVRQPAEDMDAEVNT